MLLEHRDHKRAEHLISSFSFPDQRHRAATPTKGQRRSLVLLILLTAACPGTAVTAQPALIDEWTTRKCKLYAEAWTQLVGDTPADDISAGFIAANEAFIASNCLDRGRACPRSQGEFAVADTLALMAVAEGMAGSFLPFNCPK